MSKVESFWCHEASNIRCVRESDYAGLEQELDQVKRDNAQLTFALSQEQQAYIALRAERDAALKQVDGLRGDADLYRQWFNAAHDLSPQYLEPVDYQAAARLLELLGLRVPQSVLHAALSAKT